MVAFILFIGYPFLFWWLCSGNHKGLIAFLWFSGVWLMLLFSYLVGLVISFFFYPSSYFKAYVRPEKIFDDYLLGMTADTLYKVFLIPYAMFIEIAYVMIHFLFSRPMIPLVICFGMGIFNVVKVTEMIMDVAAKNKR